MSCPNCNKPTKGGQFCNKECENKYDDFIDCIIFHTPQPKRYKKKERVMKIGDRIKYTPRQINDDIPVEGTVTHYAPRGEIFNQDMLVIDTLEHWLPASECELMKENKQ